MPVTSDRAEEMRIRLMDSGIPGYMHGGLKRYFEHHIPPGDFLTAVLENNLQEACGRADDTNRHCLFEYVKFLYNEAPAGSWGSPEKVRAWLAMREAE